VAVFALILFNSEVGQRIERHVADLWLAVRGPLPAPQEVVVVGVDEESHRRLGVPMTAVWPRALHAQLLEKLAELDPRLVVLDYLFQDPGADPAVDARLAAAMSRLPVLIARFAKWQEQTDSSGVRRQVMREVEPLDLFARSASGIFLANVPLDYGVVRSFKVELRGGRWQPPLAAVREAQAAAALPGPRDFINYYGRSGSLITIPYYLILQRPEEFPADYFKHKVVFVGDMMSVPAGELVRDSFAVPHSQGLMFGVEIHATAAANILRNEWIRRFSAASESVAVCLAAFLLTLAIVRVSPPRGALVLGGAMLLWAGGSYLAFCRGYFIPGLLLVFVILPIIFTLSAFTYYLALLRTHRDMEKALGVKLHVKR